jgi:hypothetical protein
MPPADGSLDRVMPPICTVCHRDWRDRVKSGEIDEDDFGYDTVWFGGGPPPRMRDGYQGHPPGLYWFCDEHLPLAKARQHLRAGEAFAEIEALLADEKRDRPRP